LEYGRRSSSLHWQAQSKENLIFERVIDQLIRTSSSKQLLLEYRLKTGKFPHEYCRLFLSHLIVLWDLSNPLFSKRSRISKFPAFEKKLLEKSTDPDSLNYSFADIFLAFQFFEKIIMSLKDSGIWNIHKIVSISDRTLGERSVRGN
jgi:hypothetical protein